jgi:hypothetical protein
LWQRIDVFVGILWVFWVLWLILVGFEVTICGFVRTVYIGGFCIVFIVWSLSTYLKCICACALVYSGGVLRMECTSVVLKVVFGKWTIENNRLNNLSVLFVLVLPKNEQFTQLKKLS